MVPGYGSDKGFYAPPGRVGVIPKLSSIVQLMMIRSFVS